MMTQMDWSLEARSSVFLEIFCYVGAVALTAMLLLVASSGIRRFLSATRELKGVRNTYRAYHYNVDAAPIITNSVSRRPATKSAPQGRSRTIKTSNFRCRATALQGQLTSAPKPHVYVPAPQSQEEAETMSDLLNEDESNEDTFFLPVPPSAGMNVLVASDALPTASSSSIVDALVASDALPAASSSSIIVDALVASDALPAASSSSIVDALVASDDALPATYVSSSVSEFHSEHGTQPKPTTKYRIQSECASGDATSTIMGGMSTAASANVSLSAPKQDHHDILKIATQTLEPNHSSELLDSSSAASLMHPALTFTTLGNSFSCMQSSYFSRAASDSTLTTSAAAIALDATSSGSSHYTATAIPPSGRQTTSPNSLPTVLPTVRHCASAACIGSSFDQKVQQLPPATSASSTGQQTQQHASVPSSNAVRMFEGGKVKRGMDKVLSSAKALLKLGNKAATVVMISSNDGDKRASGSAVNAFRNNKVLPAPVFYAMVHPKPPSKPSAAAAPDSKPLPTFPRSLLSLQRPSLPPLPLASQVNPSILPLRSPLTSTLPASRFEEENEGPIPAMQPCHTFNSLTAHAKAMESSTAATMVLSPDGGDEKRRSMILAEETVPCTPSCSSSPHMTVLAGSTSSDMHGAPVMNDEHGYMRKSRVTHLTPLDINVLERGWQAEEQEAVLLKRPSRAPDSAAGSSAWQCPASDAHASSTWLSPSGEASGNSSWLSQAIEVSGSSSWLSPTSSSSAWYSPTVGSNAHSDRPNMEDGEQEHKEFRKSARLHGEVDEATESHSRSSLFPILEEMHSSDSFMSEGMTMASTVAAAALEDVSVTREGQQPVRGRSPLSRHYFSDHLPRTSTPTSSSEQGSAVTRIWSAAPYAFNEGVAFNDDAQSSKRSPAAEGMRYTDIWSPTAPELFKYEASSSWANPCPPLQGQASTSSSIRDGDLLCSPPSRDGCHDIHLPDMLFPDEHNCMEGENADAPHSSSSHKPLGHLEWTKTGPAFSPFTQGLPPDSTGAGAGGHNFHDSAPPDPSVLNPAQQRALLQALLKQHLQNGMPLPGQNQLVADGSNPEEQSTLLSFLQQWQAQVNQQVSSTPQTQLTANSFPPHPPPLPPPPPPPPPLVESGNSLAHTSQHQLHQVPSALHSSTDDGWVYETPPRPYRTTSQRFGAKGDESYSAGGAAVPISHLAAATSRRSSAGTEAPLNQKSRRGGVKAWGHPSTPIHTSDQNSCRSPGLASPSTPSQLKLGIPQQQQQALPPLHLHSVAMAAANGQYLHYNVRDPVTGKMVLVPSNLVLLQPLQQRQPVPLRTSPSPTATAAVLQVKHLGGAAQLSIVPD